MQKIVLLATGTGPGTLLADDFYQGGGGLRAHMTHRHAIDPAHFDIATLERQLDGQTVFLLASCGAGRAEGSRMQAFERLVLLRAIAKRAQCGLLVTRLAHCMAKHLVALGPQIALVVSQDVDKTGGFETVYPHAVMYEALGIFSMPKVASAILNRKEVA